jgi:hypothetical protein
MLLRTTRYARTIIPARSAKHATRCARTIIPARSTKHTTR